MESAVEAIAMERDGIAGEGVASRKATGRAVNIQRSAEMWGARRASRAEVRVAERSVAEM